VGGGVLSFVVRRALSAALLVLAVASASLVLARLAPGDHLSGFDTDPLVAAAERSRLGLDQPLVVQYAIWLRGLARFDLGESTKYPGRTVGGLIAERAGYSARLGILALVVATAVGIPAGIVTGSTRRGPAASIIKALAIGLIAVPPIILSLALLLVASRTGWFPVGGLPLDAGLAGHARYLLLPVLALALPMGAVLERLQSGAMADALADPAIAAARARGLSRARIVWRHAFRLSLRPVLGVYGVVIGTLISGSFVVEYVMTWPGLGRLTYEALVNRDANLVAGCAAAGAVFLAVGVLLADITLALLDPRAEERSR
jgi:peptide/nickel transport system permease protein